MLRDVDTLKRKTKHYGVPSAVARRGTPQRDLSNREAVYAAGNERGAQLIRERVARRARRPVAFDRPCAELRGFVVIPTDRSTRAVQLDPSEHAITASQADAST